MRQRSTVLFIIGAALVGCGEGDSQKRNSTATKSKEKQKTVGDDIQTEGAGLAFSPLEFGAYLAEDLAVTGSTHISVEAGFVDVRQHKDGDKESIFDFRLKTLASGTSSGHLPVKASGGCGPVSADAFAGAAVTSAASTGFYAGTLKYKSGTSSVSDRNGGTTFKTDQPLSVVLSSTTGEVAKISGQKLPKAGSIQLAQAFDTSVSVNTMVKDLNENLAKSDQDLLIGDVGNGADYNLVVLTFYGSKSSKVAATRCIFKPGESATLTKAQYLDLWPVKAVIGIFANVVVSAANGVVLWSATYAGQGSEDLFVE